MATSTDSCVTYQVNRLRVGVDEDFEMFRARYAEAVPEVDREAIAAFVSDDAAWQDVLEQTRAAAPHGFLRYWESDVSAVMSLAGDHSRCVQYLMGNHTIAERMFRHDPAAMLYAPLRTALVEDESHRVTFVVDQPRLQFASFGVPEISEVGIELDGKLRALLVALGCQPPRVLGDC